MQWLGDERSAKKQRQNWDRRRGLPRKPGRTARGDIETGEGLQAAWSKPEMVRKFKHYAITERSDLVYFREKGPKKTTPGLRLRWTAKRPVDASVGRQAARSTPWNDG